VASGVARLDSVDTAVANVGIGMMSQEATQEQAFRDQGRGQPVLGRSWAHWLAPRKIRVNSVHPAGATTPMVLNEAVAKLFASASASSRGNVSNLLDTRLIDAVDVSNAIAWLVFDEARFVTALALPVDAAFTAR
jgi:enoyl-ACP reductase-like protein